MNIHQLSIAYHKDHDRILAQVNTIAGEELRLWFTRRLMINFLPHLGRLAIDAEASAMQLASQDELAKKTVMEFKKQESINKSDFKTPFNAKASAYPVGQEPILVTTIQLAPDGKGALRIGFEEKMTGSSSTQPARGFQMTLASPLLHGFIHLLESAIQASQWGIVDSVKTEADPLDAAIEIAKGAKSPTYLN